MQSSRFLAVLTVAAVVNSLDVDVEQYGCKAGSKDACTKGIAGAIATVSNAGGGTVHVRGPGAYIAAGIQMLSNVVLQVHLNASINASSKYSEWEPRQLSVPECANKGFPGFFTTRGVLGGLFYATNASNFTIRGPGAVNGAAAAWNTHDNPPVPDGLVRSNMFVFTQCKDVVVEDLQIQDSSAWTLNPQYSKRLSFRRLTITAPALGSRGHNTDGFDPWACEDVEFVDSYYSAGDDCVAVKSGRDSSPTSPWPCGTQYPSKNISINNITCDGSHGLTIGSEMSGGISDVRFTNIRIYNSGPSVRIKSQCGRSAYIRDVLYENITGNNVANAVWIDMQYFSKDTTCTASNVSHFDNITVRNVHIGSTTGPAYEIVGLQVLDAADPVPIKGITIENVQVDSPSGGTGVCKWADVTAVGRNSPPFPACVNAAPATCTKKKVHGCYNDTRGGGAGSVILPTYQPQVHDLVTFEACASACFGIKNTLAGIDEGNHCYCGNAVPPAAAAARSRPIAECSANACHANSAEKECGGPDRMVVYDFVCKA